VARCPGCGFGTFVVNLDVNCGRSAYFVVLFVTLGLRWAFQVQTKLVAIIVIAAFVAEPRGLLGLGPLLDYGHRNTAMTLSSTVCLHVSDSMVLLAVARASHRHACK
jgi:hypothetical protein